jgi:eukaryotic-like serine/threonine-protein kinase
MLHASWAGDADMRRRFAAEVEQARRVSGFCVAAILDADPAADRPWIATEYIDGPTLQASVEADGPRSGVELQRLAVGTATALAAIHAAGVVHRDLKPDNIMLAPDGPRVIDFGIARAVESTSVTASGIVGTVGYMAPEQLEGMRLTPAVDVFSWASVMVFAGTGREAFPGPTQAARIARVLSGEPDTGDLSGPLLDTVLACLDKDAIRRPDAAALLHHLVAGTSPGSGPGSPGSPAAVPEALTRVEALPPTPPTRVYTEIAGTAGPFPGSVAGPPDRPGHTPPPDSRTSPGSAAAAHAAPVLGRAPYPAEPPAGATRAPEPAPRGEAPPYRFAGIRHTRIEELAAAMQEHWSSAVAVFGDPAERSMLGSWVINDIHDTKVDRSLFRRQVRDANMAVASFVAQACPELPPRFRGHELTVKGLRELFHDPRPLITGGHEANELMLLARPELLRQMAEHFTEDATALRQLAQDIEEAERTGTAFHRELAQNLTGWRGFEHRVDPALVLTFLLHPGLVVPPNPGDLPGVADWTGALWRRVETSSGAHRVGCAAAVYASLRSIVTLVRQRAVWERQREVLREEHRTLAAATDDAARNTWVQAALGAVSLLFFAVSILFTVGAPGSGAGALFFLMSVGTLFVFAFMVLRDRGIHGGAYQRNARDQRLRTLPDQGRSVLEGLQRMDAEIQRARQLCSRPPRELY